MVGEVVGGTIVVLQLRAVDIMGRPVISFAWSRD